MGLDLQVGRWRRAPLGGTSVLMVALVTGCADKGVIRDPAALPRMVITSGASDYQVYQRDANGVAEIRLQGTCAPSGEVWAWVIQHPKAKQSSSDHAVGVQRVGDASAGRWSATIGGVPTGGPYDLNLEVRSPSREVLAAGEAHGLLVGDLWILAGQSNMQGVGDLIDVEEPSPTVHMFRMNEQWQVAEEPLHYLWESPNRVHHRLRNPKVTDEEIEKIRTGPRENWTKGAGLGMPFAKAMVERTGIPVGLVPCAHGGTSMKQWDPARRDEGGDSLYGQMVKRFNLVGGRVRGVLWYQGESDANPEAAKIYKEVMAAFIEAVRRDFGDTTLPFYMVQISRVVGIAADVPSWCSIRESERQLGRELPGVATVSAIDLELDDLIHIGTPGLKRLGQRMALIADRELFGNRDVTTGPRLVSAAFADNERRVIRVTLENVNGALSPATHMGGFSVRLPDGSEPVEFYDVRVDPQSPASLLCESPQPIAEGASLWYGYGTNPYCNVVDEQDMALPAFGPIPLPGK